MTKHQLPDLPYDYKALEPYIDEETMKIHHDKHHAGYVDKLNASLEKYPEFSDSTVDNLLKEIDKIPEEIREGIKNNGGGHANHSLFWQIMGPNGKNEPGGELLGAISKAFESFDKFKDEFSKAAAGRFGSGWAWLSVTDLGGLEVSSTQNQDTPLSDNKIPILNLDVWEHAYYLKYQNRRPEYIENWWRVVNWDKIAEKYKQALAKIKL